jgi:hypothetical protein
MFNSFTVSNSNDVLNNIKTFIDSIDQSSYKIRYFPDISSYYLNDDFETPYTALYLNSKFDYNGVMVPTNMQSFLILNTTPQREIELRITKYQDLITQSIPLLKNTTSGDPLYPATLNCHYNNGMFFFCIASSFNYNRFFVLGNLETDDYFSGTQQQFLKLGTLWDNSAITGTIDTLDVHQEPTGEYIYGEGGLRTMQDVYYPIFFSNTLNKSNKTKAGIAISGYGGYLSFQGFLPGVFKIKYNNINNLQSYFIGSQEYVAYNRFETTDQKDVFIVKK